MRKKRMKKTSLYKTGLFLKCAVVVFISQGYAQDTVPWHLNTMTINEYKIGIDCFTMASSNNTPEYCDILTNECNNERAEVVKEACSMQWSCESAEKIFDCVTYSNKKLNSEERLQQGQFEKCFRQNYENCSKWQKENDPSNSISPVELHYVEYTPKSLKHEHPIIFIHGVFAEKGYWYDVSHKISEATGRKIYAIDSRDHGENPCKDGFSLETNRKDLENFMDTMNISKTILIGHSMGGMTSIKMALHAPERVEKVIVEDMAVNPLARSLTMKNIYYVLKAYNDSTKVMPPDCKDEDSAFKWIKKYYFPKNFPALVKTETHPNPLKGTFIRSTPCDETCQENHTESCEEFKMESKSGPFVFKTCMDIVLTNVVDVLFKDYADLFPAGSGYSKKRYSGPALFIHGDTSFIPVKSNGKDIKNLFTRAELHEIKNATHYVHVDQPEDFVNVAINFLNRKL